MTSPSSLPFLFPVAVLGVNGVLGFSLFFWTGKHYCETATDFRERKEKWTERNE